MGSKKARAVNVGAKEREKTKRERGKAGQKNKKEINIFDVFHSESYKLRSEREDRRRSKRKGFRCTAFFPILLVTKPPLPLPPHLPLLLLLLPALPRTR